jgi:hypothetical protein
MLETSEAIELKRPVNWKRVALLSGILAGTSIIALALLPIEPSPFKSMSSALPAKAKHIRIPQKHYSSSEYVAIQETFWTRIKGKDRDCAQAYVDNYMGALREDCETDGGAANIGGGCAHMTNPMNYPEVLEAGLRHCGIKN